MIPVLLNTEQQRAIELEGNVLVTACPGSGKTRVLTARAIASAAALGCNRKQIAAVTFTNRAANEIKERIRSTGYNRRNIWTGTIHAFSIEWILRPYCCYHSELKHGFTIADEYRVRRIIDQIRPNYNVGRFTEIRTAFERSGELETKDPETRRLIQDYRKQLKESRLIDFDQVLYFAYQLVQNNPSIGKTLSAIFSEFCIDEYQDTQDLQYAIVSSVIKQGEGASRFFIVGDVNQAIYTSLGGVAKSEVEVKMEFGVSQLSVSRLIGNYRSTQRIVDYFSNFGNNVEGIRSFSKYSEEPGLITYCNQTSSVHDLPEQVASLIRFHLINGIQEKEICVLAPTWPFAQSIARQLSRLVPEAGFDAPGVSPLRYQPDSIWFQVARLFLTEPHPSRYSIRLRWASELMRNIEREVGLSLSGVITGSRDLLRRINTVKASCTDSLGFLEEVFGHAHEFLCLPDCPNDPVNQSKIDFLDGVKNRIGETAESGVDDLRRLFKYPSGIVVSSCHGVKGEEFDVVICFGLLHGRIPHWTQIHDNTVDHRASSCNLLYVIASRAKRHLHLFSESGRATNKGYPYKSTHEISSLSFLYDNLEDII